MQRSTGADRRRDDDHQRRLRRQPRSRRRRDGGVDRARTAKSWCRTRSSCGSRPSADVQRIACRSGGGCQWAVSTDRQLQRRHPQRRTCQLGSIPARRRSSAALAVASLTHALVLSVRRRRGPAGHPEKPRLPPEPGARSRGVPRQRPCRSWPPSSACRSGSSLGRWGWQIVADEVGVASPPVTPLLVAGRRSSSSSSSVANLVAAYPGWRAGSGTFRCAASALSDPAPLHGIQLRPVSKACRTRPKSTVGQRTTSIATPQSSTC